MQDKQSVYDKDGFFDLYQKLRSNPNSLNEIVEKPTMLGLVGDVSGKRILDLGCGCGEHLKRYLERGAAFVAGIDLSQAMLQQAAKKSCRISTALFTGASPHGVFRTVK